MKFPLNQKTVNTTTTNSIVSTFKPSNEFEKEMSEVLNKTNEEKLKEDEELNMIELTPEEVRAKQIELARLRSLLFFQELKAKRKAKIKSKSYHKILRKEKMKREEETIRELEQSDPEAAKEYRDKLEKERIIERMTLKHKNTSKWARQMKKKGLTKITGVRRAIEQQLELNKQLEQKIRSMTEEDDDDDAAKEYSFLLDKDKKEQNNEDPEEIVDESEMTVKEKMKRNAMIKLKALDSLSENATKGLLSLSFIAKDRARQREQLTKFLNRIDDYDDNGDLIDGNDDDDGSDSENGDDIQSDVDDDLVKKNKKKEKEKKKDKAEKELADALKRSIESIPGRRIFNNVKPNSENSVPQDSNSKHAQTRYNMITSSLSSRIQQALNKKKAEQKQGNYFQEFQFNTDAKDNNEQEKTKNNEKAKETKKEITPNKKEKPKKAVQKESVESKSNQWLESDKNEIIGEEEENVMIADVDEDSVNVDVPMLLGQGSVSQKALLAQAFAQDDVVESWDNSKKELAQEDANIEAGEFSSSVLPGWGAWTGEGTRMSKSTLNKIKREKAAHEQKIEDALKARKDARMKNVIINQKVDKKANAYTLSEVPRGFSKEQYNSSLNMPLGREWYFFVVV